MPKRKSDLLVREYLERVSGRTLDAYRPIIARMIKSHAGIYALYKGDRLYYVGLASNMMGRVKTHDKDRHAKRWDRFSVYLTARSDHIRPLEALVLRITSPSGNRVRGKLRGAKDLYQTLNREMSEADKDARAVLLGERALKKRRRRKTQTTKGSRPLSGLMNRSLRLRAIYKGKKYLATLRRDGRIRYAGKLYDSPSAAGRAVVGRGVIGWLFWKFRKGRDAWVPLRELKR
ncbi:MAG: hypothetical protein J0L91_03660 [Burkholderiales bacterium]|nr:hypothetical protein [Burkholderiales bacterium]